MNDANARSALNVNGRSYAWPDAPLVLVCIDGSEPEYEIGESGYMEQAMSAGAMPWLKRALENGTRRLADCVVPTFTNPNNLSIVTGVPPAVHGICGNFFYDTENDAEVMMNDPSLLRAGTVFAAFAAAGAKITVITAKDKLRGLLGVGLPIGAGESICFSAERADEATLENNGIENVLELVGLPKPSVYSADLSEFVFAAGVQIMQRERPEIMYLSTTDYIQHKHEPGSETANAFYQMMDGYWQQLDAMGATIALTADHGMKAKHGRDGLPDVIYLQSLLDEWLGAGAARVILPITDPYVVHHGALGGFATAYLPADADVASILERIASTTGVECALSREAACERFELPPDRIGDVVIVATSGKVLGSSPERHDLSGLEEPLRSHGSVSEQRVPFYLNRPTKALPADAKLRNFDLLDVALNHVEEIAR